MKLLLNGSAAIEGITGVALIVAPQLLARLLLGSALDDAGLAVARIAGLALISLGLACFSGSNSPQQAPQCNALLLYNLSVAGYLAALGIAREPDGVLLWPTVGLHALIGLLFLLQIVRQLNHSR